MSDKDGSRSIEDVKQMLKSVEAFLSEDSKKVLNDAISNLENKDGNIEESKAQLQKLLASLLGKK